MAGYIGNQAQIRSGLSATIDELNIIDGVTATTAELNYNDTGAAVGTVVASKTVTADANKDVASLRNVTATGVATVGSVVVADGGNIGAASDTDSLAIASNGVVTFSQAPVFPDGSLNLADLDIDGGTDIGAALVDADLMIVDDGAGGTNRKATMSRLATYMGTKIGGGLEFISSTDISDAATVSFTGFDASKYDNYVFYIQNVTITGAGGVDFGLRTSSNGGSSYDSGSSDYQWVSKGQRATSDEDSYDVADTDIRLTFSQGGDTGEEGGASGTVQIFGPHLTTKTRVSSNLGFFNSGSEGQPSMQIVNGVRESEADVDAVQFFMSSGNIASGTITMYGMVNS
jgi:hypothetical protein